jgi:D-alanine-D-alanine ligase
MTGPLHIVVLAGGPGSEREVSLHSGAGVTRALRSLGHEVTEVDPRERQFALPPSTDVVFLALHGAYGEDGTVQRELETLGVPYTGCGVEVSRIAFDKVLTKQRCVAAGVVTPRFEVFDSPDAKWPEGWQPPAILKPVCQGSSVGLHFINAVAGWSAAIEDCLQHDTRALLEERVTGRECTVGILAGRTLPIVEVRPRSGKYDYQSKYTVGATEYLCPAPWDDDLTASVQAAARAAFNAIGGGDYARVDMMVAGDGTPYVIEVNTLPGMTETSLLPKAAAAAGVGYAALCDRMVRLALARAAGSPQPAELMAVAD